MREISCGRRTDENQGKRHETSSIPASRERGARRFSRRRACNRAIIAGSEMAIDSKLAEIARYALRWLRIFLQARRRNYRQQIPNPGLRGWRNCSGLAGPRRREQWHGRNGQYGALLLLGQGSLLYLWNGAAFRAQYPADDFLDSPWRRRRTAERSSEGLQLHRICRGKHWRSDGRLVSQGNQHQ